MRGPTPGHPDDVRKAARLEAAALAVRDGWVSRTALRHIAFRSDEVDEDDLDRFLHELVRTGCFETKHDKFSGRHGRAVDQYRATKSTSYVVDAPRFADDVPTE